ncbi:hypothetical protein BGX21_005162, partial [Mortierella sp. AD011]
HGSWIWYIQIWNWYFRHGNLPSRTDDEGTYPCRHGWYYLCLRTRHLSLDCRIIDADRLFIILRVCPPWGRSLCRFDGIGCRIRHWYCRRCVCQRIRVPAKTLCSYGVGTDFRRSLGTIWIDCRIDFEHKS